MSFLIPVAISEAAEQFTAAAETLAGTVYETAVEIVETPGVLTNAVGSLDGSLSIITCALRLAAEFSASAGVVAVEGVADDTDDAAVQAVVNLIDLFTGFLNSTNQLVLVNQSGLGPLVDQALQAINQGLKWTSFGVCALAG